MLAPLLTGDTSELNHAALILQSFRPLFSDSLFPDDLLALAPPNTHTSGFLTPLQEGFEGWYNWALPVREDLTEVTKYTNASEEKSQTAEHSCHLPPHLRPLPQQSLPRKQR